MSESKFKTMRHIETVRNFLQAVIDELAQRGIKHDQTKLQDPEVQAFEKYTPLLKDLEYGSDEYKETLRKMAPAIKHHNDHNRHHPEHHMNGINDMNLIDLLEMICDWKAAGSRHTNGDIFNSLEITRERFGIDAQLYKILWNTSEYINLMEVQHHAEES